LGSEEGGLEERGEGREGWKGGGVRGLEGWGVWFGGGGDWMCFGGWGELNKGRIGGGRDFGGFRRRGVACVVWRGVKGCVWRRRGGGVPCLEDGG